MTHAEYTYLVFKAHMLWDLEQAAAEKGHTFLPSNHFDPVSPEPLEAQARIYRASPTSPTEITLCLRYPADAAVDDAVLLGVAAVFFAGEAFEQLYTTPVDAAWRYAVFFSRVVPPSVVPIT